VLSQTAVAYVPPAPQSHSQLKSDITGLIAANNREADELTNASEERVLPGTMLRLIAARTRIFEAARAGQRIRTYEVALDLDMSEFHFARQFRLAFDRSPHVYYDEVRAESARALLAAGLSDGVVARKIGFRRPAELRALLSKRVPGTLPPELMRA
jgi:AraC-like DNA-binding protein